MSTVKADNFTWKTGEATAQSGTTVTGPQIVYGVCKAWMNFNGVSGSVAARSSFNFSSVTRGGTAGYYLLSFTNAMPDANHVSTGNAQPNNYGGAYPGFGDTAAGTQLSTRVSIETRDANNAATDSNFLQVCVHR